MELIDTHCHLTFKHFGDVAAVIARSRQAGVIGWVVVGTDAEDSRKIVELAGDFDNMYAAVGIHPHYAKDVTAETLNQLREIGRDEKVVAIGETGLDFHYNFSPQDEQEKVFAQHLRIAAESNLPVIVHSREAFDQTMEILDSYAANLKKIVFHCFSGSAEQVKIVLEKGFFVSFTGVVTFKNAHQCRKAAEIVPLDRLMIETDCPYMSPEPMRKQKVNEPALMVHTAEFLAELKAMSLADFAEAVTATSKQFFNI